MTVTRRLISRVIRTKMWLRQARRLEHPRVTRMAMTLLNLRTKNQLRTRKNSMLSKKVRYGPLEGAR